jgi:Fe-S oxidoreductase
VVAAANPGCALQIEAHSRDTGEPVEVVHPIELVHRSLIGRPARG